MIKSQTVKVKTKGFKNISRLQDLGYDISNEEICIDVNHLNRGSRVIVDCICDYCGKEVSVFYKEYLRNIENSINKYACSKKCGSEKSKEFTLKTVGVESKMCLNEYKEKVKRTNNEKYGGNSPTSSKEVMSKIKNTLRKNWGVDHISKTDHFKKKFKETNIERYGVEYPQQSSLIRQKSKETCLKNWGVDNPMKSDEIKKLSKLKFQENWGVDHYSKTELFIDRLKNHNLEKWGTENPNELEDIKEKTKNTNFEKYGVAYPQQSPIIREKTKQTLLDKFGVDNPTKNSDIKNKARQTTLSRWGVESILSLDSIRKKAIDSIKSDEYRMKFQICNHPGYLGYEGSSISTFICENGHEFQIKFDNFYHRNLSGVGLCTICNPISNSSSISENEIFSYISSIYGGEIIKSYRDGLEIDIFLPELKIGFEYNGIFWHSDRYLDKDYHFQKSKYFENRGIRIINIWEDDWKFKTSIIKSQIGNVLGINSRIFARNCSIEEIKESSKFLNQNHLQGGDRSLVKMGLYHKGDLVSIMTFNKSEGRKKMGNGEWNLSRFCNRIGYTVVGGASRILKYFNKKYGPTRIVSYADADWSRGDLYKKLGFKLVYQTDPDYKYIIDNKRINKSRFRKSFIGESESVKMERMKISKIWDCGKIKFELIL